MNKKSADAAAKVMIDNFVADYMISDDAVLDMAEYKSLYPKMSIAVVRNDIEYRARMEMSIMVWDWRDQEVERYLKNVFNWTVLMILAAYCAFMLIK